MSRDGNPLWPRVDKSTPGENDRKGVSKLRENCMAEELKKWPSNLGTISKIGSSDGYEKDAVLLAVRRRYDFQGFAYRLGNVGLKK